jgi:hypothetical protein
MLVLLVFIDWFRVQCLSTPTTVCFARLTGATLPQAFLHEQMTLWQSGFAFLQ